MTDDVELAAFATAAAAEVTLPADGHVVGEPVTVAAIRYPGSPRIGLLATCECDGRTYEVSLADVVFPPGSAGAGFVGRYRAWLGFDPGTEVERTIEPPRPHKVASDDIAVGKPVELLVLACKSNALRCRLLGSTREVTLRTAVRDEIAGSIIEVTPRKQWTHARHPYLSGDVAGVRVDASVLGLVPLRLHPRGEWDPLRPVGRDLGDPARGCMRSALTRGRRAMFEMERLVPAGDPDDPDLDAILAANERYAAGDRAEMEPLLTSLLAQDLRCLDAHALLGDHEFQYWPVKALRHYTLGAAIGALSLGQDFEGVVPWELGDNRPFLRCLRGTGRCAFRLGDTDSAASAFHRLLQLDPGDGQDARSSLAAIEAGRTWKELEERDR